MPSADPDDLARRYEDVRAAALGERAGLGAALLMAQGTAAWMRGWRACTPLSPLRVASADTGRMADTGRHPGAGPPAEIVGVLAAMALACAEGG